MNKLALLTAVAIGLIIGLMLIGKQHDYNIDSVNGTVISINERDSEPNFVQLSQSASHSYPVRQLQHTLSSKPEFLSLPDNVTFDSTKIKKTSPIKDELQGKKAKIETLKQYITTE
ncbi:hypothetical protein [Vibrio hippocampi]|uniref:Uncharacterized protein n=1 Tax=Vibrio hippocampi TaxID=654686 RepID=A0ABN8DCW5_9VIBR|nr:hypothetical protein [Vibrio hippocampi]CAH0524616.1 hypothetical protein VHP8226_00464 [Vibrio hippocampi]